MTQDDVVAAGLEQGQCFLGVGRCIDVDAASVLEDVSEHGAHALKVIDDKDARLLEVEVELGSVFGKY